MDLKIIIKFLNKIFNRSYIPCLPIIQTFTSVIGRKFVGGESSLTPLNVNIIRTFVLMGDQPERL